MSSKRKETPTKSAGKGKKPRTVEKPSLEEQRRRAREWAESMKSASKARAAEKSATEDSETVPSRGRGAAKVTGKRSTSTASVRKATTSAKKKVKSAHESESEESEEEVVPPAMVEVATPKRRTPARKKERIPTPRLPGSTPAKSSSNSATTPGRARTPQVKKETVQPTTPFSNETVPAHLSALPVEANLKTSDLSLSDVPRPSQVKVKSGESGFFERLIMFVITVIIAAFSYYDLQIGVTTVVLALVLSAARRLLSMLFSPREKFVRDASMKLDSH